MARRADTGRRRRKRRRSAEAGRARPQAGGTSAAPAAAVAPAEPGGADGKDGTAGRAEQAARSGPSSGYRSRSEEKNAAVRASLEPLAEGERPTVVTVGAVLAFVLAVGNVALYLAGVEINGERPSPVSLAFPALLFVAAWGMWRARYWAVLGMQALLALTLISLSIALIVFFSTGDFARAAISLAVIAAAGALFWFMVKAMARIQMPERR